jgi:hypothetical protein
MTFRELTYQFRIPVFLTNEERTLYYKLKKGTKLKELNERERDVILQSLRVKGLAE